MLRIFTPVKIQRLRPGSNPRTWEVTLTSPFTVFRILRVYLSNSTNYNVSGNSDQVAKITPSPMIHSTQEVAKESTVEYYR